MEVIVVCILVFISYHIGRQAGIQGMERKNRAVERKLKKIVSEVQKAIDIKA